MEINTTPNATNQRKGVAKFDSTQFEVENGNVKLNVDDTPVNGELKQPVSSNWAYDHVADTSTHGVTGAIVGTTDTQELDNKTLDSSVLKGTFTASGTVTLPSFTEAGNITMPAGGTVGLTGALITHTANAPALNAGSGSLNIDTTGDLAGITIDGTGANHGTSILQKHTHTTPDATRAVGNIQYQGYDGNASPALQRWGVFGAYYNNVTDTTEQVMFQWYGMDAGTPDNLAMKLLGSGALSVDLGGTGSAAQVDLFDDYDDALVLKQTIQQNNREMLVDMGIAERKDTGSGYMLKIQPMIRLLAGGIYQSREMIDRLIQKNQELEDKLDKAMRLLEAK